MSLALPTDRLAMRLIVAVTTAAWIGIVVCIATQSGKGVLGGGLPPWVTVATVLLGFSSILLTFITCILLVVHGRKTCTLKETATLIYGFSFVVAPLLGLFVR